MTTDDTTWSLILAGQQSAWNSYARLAARLNCDPLKLAEADVLGALWDELSERESMHEHASRINRLAEQCRQPEDAT